MGSEPVDLIKIYNFPTGRLIFALGVVLVEAEAIAKAMKAELGELPADAELPAPLTELLAFIVELKDKIAVARETLKLEMAFAGRTDVQHAPGARAADARLDKALTAFVSTLESKRELYGADHPIGRPPPECCGRASPEALAR